MTVDLHLHTTASDGSYTPQEVVAKAKELGFQAIAITDHDTTEGIEPALAAGEKYGLEVIPGVELSTDIAGQEIHILGYLMDWGDPVFTGTLAKMRGARHTRARQIVEKLRQLGLDITFAEVARVAGQGAIGRPHIAKVLQNKGYVASVGEAFDRYLGLGKPAHVPRFKLTPEEGVQIIREARGLPVLAHPGLVSGARELIDRLMAVGLLGLEAYHSDHDEETTRWLIKLAGEKELLIAGGSDCHGPLFKDKHLLGGIRAPYHLVEELKKKHQALYC